MKLLIAIPSLDYMHVDFVKSLVGLTERLHREGVAFDVCIESGTLVYVARDRLTCKAINDGYTHVLWFDADMVFNDSILDDLMFSGHDFVCGVFHARRKGFHSCIFSDIRLNSLTRVEEYPAETFEIAGCGFGCVLVKADILREVQINYGTTFLPMKSYGEDLACCKRIAELGHKMYCEPSARVGHIGHIAIYPEDHERWKSELMR